MNQPLQNQPGQWNSGLSAFAAINRRITRTEERITRQQTLIERMLADGDDVEEAGDALAVHTTALQVMHECREIILRRMNG